MRAGVVGISAAAALHSFAMVGSAAALEGWTRSVEGGSVLYACRSGKCGRSALISCRVVGGNAITSSEQHAARVQSQIEALRAAGRQVAAGEIRRTVRGDRVLYQAAYSVEPPRGPAGEQFRSGYLVGPTETFSIVASSADAKTTREVFDRFVTRLSNRSKEGGVGECQP